MISATSLQAFSAATTTQGVDRAGPARLVREAGTGAAAQRQAEPPAPLPEPRPGLPPPRGSLLNLVT
jgi:hypothetical protein